MQDEITDFRGLISKWPTLRAFGQAVTGDPETGRIFHRRNRVPRSRWPSVIKAAREAGVDGVTTEFLERLYAAGRGVGR